MATNDEIRIAGNELALHALKQLKRKKALTGEDLRGIGSLLNALRRWKGKASRSSDPDETEEQRIARLEWEGDPDFAESLMD